MTHLTDQHHIVRTDRSRFRRQAMVLGPIAGVAAIIFTIRLAAGYRTAEGIGPAAIPIMAVVALLPVIAWGVHALLWIRNGRIVHQLDGISVKTWISREVRMMDPVVIPWGDVVVLHGEGTAVVIDPKQWEPGDFRRIIGRLPVEEVVPGRLAGSAGGRSSSSWKTLVRRQTQGRVTRVIGPFRLMHAGIYGTLWTVVVIAAIAFVVNIEKFLTF